MRNQRSMRPRRRVRGNRVTSDTRTVSKNDVSDNGMKMVFDAPSLHGEISCYPEATDEAPIKHTSAATTLKGKAVVRSTAKTHAVRVILDGSSDVAELCRERESLESPDASVSPDITVTSLSDIDTSSPDASDCDSSEEESFEETSSDVDTGNTSSDFPRLAPAPQSCENEENVLDCSQESITKGTFTDELKDSSSFLSFRINYLVVMTAIMLADGLQGTHLYVLYEGYGYSVASLYCLGFLTGAVASPITGPLVDRFGRKKSALAYCILEIAINQLEQYPYLPGLIISRMVGGITTNLLGTVFETWLDTEYRRRGFNKKDYEICMRDSVVVSNLAAIASGYLAHVLADRIGPKGPFQGAVTCTAIALGVVMLVWTENYGSTDGLKTAGGYLRDAYTTFKSDSKVLRVGLIQGLTTGAIQIFIFLWSPSLRAFAKSAPLGALGVDEEGEPSYGLIFGAFMACGVLGGLAAPWVRKAVTLLLSPLSKLKDDIIEVEGEGEVKPMAVEFLAASCYTMCSLLLLTPCLLSSDGVASFAICLVAFLMYELIVGIYMPNEGVIRSIYLPSDSRCSLLTMPQVIVNVAVSLGVVSTNLISLQTAFAAVSFLMMTAAILQLTLVSPKEWASLFGRVDHVKKSARRLSSTTCEALLKRSSSALDLFQQRSDSFLSSDASVAADED